MMYLLFSCKKRRSVRKNRKKKKKKRKEEKNENFIVQTTIDGEIGKEEETCSTNYFRLFKMSSFFCVLIDSLLLLFVAAAVYSNTSNI